jgi:hypothetical protein
VDAFRSANFKDGKASTPKHQSGFGPASEGSKASICPLFDGFYRRRFRPSLFESVFLKGFFPWH